MNHCSSIISAAVLYV